jgi:hypothetical protein
MPRFFYVYGLVTRRGGSLRGGISDYIVANKKLPNAARMML